MTGITTHVLDTAQGRPAAGVHVELEAYDGSAWRRIARGVTDKEGRIRSLMPADTALLSGVYRLTFDTAAYYRAQNTAAFYPRVLIEFSVAEGESHYHVPLLLSPFGYSTYRGT
jgi:5-hydroxyisourate hydrolase